MTCQRAFHLYSTPLRLFQKKVATILRIARSGGAGRDRTDDILLAKQALSQLSYGPLITPLRSYPVEEIDNPCGLRSGGPGRT
ncbi:hypothetical protein MES5069_580004 [Mesorhizobium escarrei]|uniref:Uncharacterized protein n=1 Tax=Mesorhizobium escarrei TaxID=666018 RepID=A0ABN8KAP0_9HYPH|nr:hypothetical protein MES5069_580004 [Mesorhizobium escarrei]